jgi:hypothetical protein
LDLLLVVVDTLNFTKGLFDLVRGKSATTVFVKLLELLC